MSPNPADQLHMWSYIVPSQNQNPNTSHGTCGVHIGRFTSKVEEVTCTKCLAVINAKKESDESSESDRQ